MSSLSLSQLLDVAIGTPEAGAVNFTALHSLLRALLGHLGLQDLPARELLEGGRPGKAPPDPEKGNGSKVPGQGTEQQPQRPRRDSGQETAGSPQVASVDADVGEMKKKIKANESGVSKDLLGEINGMKATQSRMGEDIRAIQEALGLGNLPDAAARLVGLRDQMALDNEVKSLKERLSLYPAPEEVSNMVRWEVLEDCLVSSRGGGEGGGGCPGLPAEGSEGRFAPAKTPTSDVDTLHGASSALGLKGPGTQPVCGSSKETPGTQSGSLETQAEIQKAPETPEKQPSAPSDQTRPSDASATTLGTQIGAPGIQTTTPGMQQGASSTEITTPGMQPETPGTQTTTPGMQPETPGTQTTTPGMQPGSPSTQTTTPGMQPGSPSTQTTTPGMQPGSPSTQITTPGMQPETPGTQTTTPGMQPGTPGTQTTTPGMQPAPSGTQEGRAEVQPSPTGMEPRVGAKKVPSQVTPSGLRAQMDATSPREGGKALSSTQLAQADHPAVETLSPPAQELDSCLDTDASSMSPSQELAVPWGSSGSLSAPNRYADTVEALQQLGQLGHLYTALKEQVAQLEATKLDHAEVEKLRQLFPEGDQESIASVLADLRGQVSSLQGLASDLQSEKDKVRQLEDALGKLKVAGADSETDDSNQITLQLGATLQEIKQEPKELGEEQETTKATLEQLVTKTSAQLQEQLDQLRMVVESMVQEQAELQAGREAACAVCSTDLGMQVGQLLQRYEKLQELVDSFMSQQPVGKVVRQLPGKTQGSQPPLRGTTMSSSSLKQDKELLKHIQATIVHLQGDYEKLSSVTGNLLDNCHQKQKDIEALFQSLERLEKEKADKEDLLLGIAVKADKSSLDGKVSCTQFETSMERLNEVIQEVLSRVTGQEQGWHQVQQQLSEEMGSKLDRLELGPFQQRLEERWRSLLEKLREKGLATVADDAAGIKKQLLAHFHCVSCERPLHMRVPGPHIVAIPSMPRLPSHLSGNSSTVIEQEQTNGHRPRYRYPSVPRHCGGCHTLTHPLQRCQPPKPFPPSTPRPPRPPTRLSIKRATTKLLGQDGHVYRGQQDGQQLVLVAKEGFLRAKPMLSPRREDAQDPSRLLSRPQSARSSLSQLGTPTSLEHSPASSHGHLSRDSGLLPPLQDGSGTPAAGPDRGSPGEPPLPQAPSRRASSPRQ